MPKKKLGLNLLFGPKRRTSKGFINLLNLIGLTFFIISLFVGVVVITKEDSNFDMRKLAKPIEDTEVAVKKTSIPVSTKSPETTTESTNSPVCSSGSTCRYGITDCGVYNEVKTGTCAGGICCKASITPKPTTTPKPTITPNPTNSPVCSSGSTCRYGITDCGVYNEVKTGTCAGGICCKQMANVNSVTPVDSDQDSRTIADLYNSKNEKKDSVIDRKIGEIINGNEESNKCDVISYFGNCGQDGCKENQLLKTFIASDCSKTSVCVYSLDCESAKLADSGIDSKVNDIGAGFNVSQWFSENIINKFLSLFKIKDKKEKRISTDMVSQETINEVAVTTTEAFCDPNLEKDCLYGCEPNFDGGECKKKSSIISEKVTENQTSLVNNQGAIPEKVLEKFELSSLKDGKQSCSNNYKAGEIVIWGGYVQGCDGETGKWVNLSSKGYGPEVLTVVPSWLTPESNTWKSLIDSSKLAPAYVNAEGEFIEPEKEKWCNTDSGGVPSGTVSLGGLGVRSRCSNGEWKACSDDPNDLNNYCSLTLVPSYIKNNEGELEKLENETKIYDQNISNYLVLYQEKYQECNKTNTSECLSEANQFLANEGLGEEIAKSIQNQFVNQMTVYVNLVPVLEDYQYCLSIKNESECVDEKALVTKVTGFTNIDTNLLVQFTNEYVSTEYQDLVSQYIDLKFKAINCSNSEGSLKNFSSECKNILNELTQIERNPIFKYFEARDKMVNCNSSEECEYWEEQMQKISEDEVFGNVSDFELIAKNYFSPEKIFEQSVTKNLYIQKAIQALYFNDGYALREACLMENLSSPNKCLGSLDSYKNSVLEQLTDEERNIIQEYQEKYEYLAENVESQISSVPYSTCTRSVGYYSASTLSCSKGYSCISGFCIPGEGVEIEESTLSESEKQEVFSDIASKQSYCNNVLPGSLYNRTTNLCVLETSNVPEVVSIGREVVSSYNCSSSEYFYNNRCYLKEAAAYDILAGASGFGNFVEKYEEKLARCRDEAIDSGEMACEGDVYTFQTSKTSLNSLVQKELSLEANPDDRLNWYGENTSLLLEIAKIIAIKDIEGSEALNEYYLEGEGKIDNEKLIEEGILDEVEEKAWAYLKANVRNTSTTVFGFKLDDGYSMAGEVAINVSYLEKYSEENRLNFAELVSLNYNPSFDVDENNNLVKTGTVLEDQTGSLIERMGANLVNQGRLNEARSEMAADWFDSLTNPDNPEYIYNQVYGNGVNSISSSLSLTGEGIDFTTSYSDWIKENPIRETLFDYASEASFEYTQTVKNNPGYRFASAAETVGAVIIGMVSGVVKPAGPTGFAIGTAIEVGGDLVLHGIVDASTQNTKERFVEKLNADENINQSVVAQANSSFLVSKVGEYIQVAVFDVVANAAGETFSKFIAGKGIADRFEDGLVFSIGKKVDPSVIYSLGDEVWDGSRVLVQNELGEIIEVTSKEEALELLSKNYTNWTIADNIVQSNARDLLIGAKNSNLGSIFTSYSEKKIVQNISEGLTLEQRVIFETLSDVDEVLSGSEKSILRTWIDNRNALRAPTEETLKAGQDVALKGEYNIKLQNGLSIDPQKAADEGLNITIVSGNKVKFSGSALDYLEAINTGKLILSTDDLIEFGAEVAVRNQVGEELSESTLKSFSGIDSISYPNYVRLANGDKIILGASSDDIKLEGVKAGNVVEIVRDGKLTKGVVGIEGDVSELTGFSAFAVSNQKGLRLAAGIDIDSGKFEFASWIKNGVFADDVPLGKLANQVDELFESGEKKALTKEVKLIREYHSKGLIDYEYNIVTNVDGENIGVSGFKIKVSDEINSADREIILQRASKIEKSSEDLVIKYDAVMRSSNKMSPITEVELRNGTVLTKVLDESDSDFAYRIASLRIESPDDFIDARITTKSGLDTSFFSWRIDETGDTIQPDVILDAVLTPGTKIVGAPTGLGKSMVAIENIAILKKEILGPDTKITIILKDSGDLNDFVSVFDDKAAEFFGFKAYVIDKIPPDASDLAIIEEANFFVGTSDTIFNSLEDSGMGNKLVQAFKGSVLIGDEGHISLRSDVDYIKSVGESLVIEPNRARRFQELFDPDDGLLREITGGHLEDLRLNQKSSQIVDILDTNGNVIKEGFSDEVRGKAYRVMIESRLKDFPDVPELRVLLESDDLVTSLGEFLNVPRVTDSKISEVIQALSEDISALNSVEKILTDVPVNGYDFVENAKTFVDKNEVGYKISGVVPKENNVPTGRQYSQVDDELAYQYLGRKFLGVPVDDISELNLFVTPDSIGTNYGRFLKETFNLDESVVLSATPGKIQNQWLNRFGISTSLYGTTKQDIPERLLTNLQENFVSLKSLDEIEVSDVLKVGDDSPSVYVIGANKTNNNEVLSRIQRRSMGEGRDLAIISGSGDVFLYKASGEKVLISDGLLGIEVLESTYKKEGEVLDIVYELGRNYATDLNTLPESRFITIFDSSSDVTDFVQTIGRDRCKGGCRDLMIVFLSDQEISSDTFLELITKNEANNLAKISVSDVDGEIKNAGYRFIQRLQELDNQKGLGGLFREENDYDEIYKKWRVTSDLDTTVKATGVTPEEYIVQQTNRLQSFINELYEDTSFRNSLSKKAQEFLAESYGDLFNASDISLLTVAKNVDNLSPLSNSVNAKELIESVNSTFSASDFPKSIVSKNLSSGQVKVLQDVQNELQENLIEEQSKKTTAFKVQDALNKIKVNTKSISSTISNTVENVPILKTTRDFIVLGPKGWIKVIGSSKVVESFKSIFTKNDSELGKELVIDEPSSSVTEALLERGKTINIMAHGIEEEKGGLDNLVNIMTQGIIGNKEEDGVFTGQLSEGDPKYLSGPHGPYYVVLAIRDEDFPEQVEIGNGIGYKPETHKAYLVPDIESKNEVIEKLENLEKSNQIDLKTKEQLLEKLFTYEEYLALGEIQPTQEEITKIEKEAKATDEINKLKEKYEREFDEKNNIQYLGYSTDSYLSQKGITSSRPSEQSLFMRIESSSMVDKVTISLINIDSDSGVELKVDDEAINIDLTDKVSIKVGQKVELGSFSFTFMGTENSTGLERVKLQILGSSDYVKATDKSTEVKKDFFLVGLIKDLFKGIQKGFYFVFDKVINLVKSDTVQKIKNSVSNFLKKERKVEVKLNLVSRVLLKFDEFQNKDKGLYKIINAKPFSLRWITSRTLLPQIFGSYDLTRVGINFAIKVLKIKPQEVVVDIGEEIIEEDFKEKLKESPEVSEGHLNELDQTDEQIPVTGEAVDEERQKLINEYEEALSKCRKLDSDLDFLIVLRNIDEQPNERISYQINLIKKEIAKLEEFKEKWEKAKNDYLDALETLGAFSPTDISFYTIDYETVPYRDYDSIEIVTNRILKNISTDRKDVLTNRFKDDPNALKLLASPFLNNLVVSDMVKGFSGSTAAVYSVFTFDKQRQVREKIIAKVYFGREENATKEQKAFDLVSGALHSGEYSLPEEISYIPEFYYFDETNKILFMEYAKEKMDLTKPIDLAYLVQLAHFGYLLRQSDVVPKDYKFSDNLYVNGQQLKVIDIGLYDNSLDEEYYYKSFLKDFGDLLGTYDGTSYFAFQNELSQKTNEEVVNLVNSKNIPDWAKYLILYSRGLIDGQAQPGSLESYRAMLFNMIAVAKQEGISEEQIPDSLKGIYNSQQEIDKRNNTFNEGEISINNGLTFLGSGINWTELAKIWRKAEAGTNNITIKKFFGFSASVAEILNLDYVDLTNSFNEIVYQYFKLTGHIIVTNSGAFDPSAEIEKLWRTEPNSEERRSAIDAFKQRYVFQQLGISEMKMEIESLIKTNPQVKQSELLSVFDKYSYKYLFPYSYRINMIQFVKDYQKIRRNLNEIKKEYKDTRKLYKDFFGMYPEGDLEVTFHSFYVLFRVSDQKDYAYLLLNKHNGQQVIMNEETEKRVQETLAFEGNKYFEGKDYFYVVANNKTDESDIYHEERHVINDLLNLYMDVVPKAQIARNINITPQVLSGYVVEVEDYIMELTKDEVIAYLAGGTNPVKIKYLLTLDYNKGGSYDYYHYFQGDEWGKKILFTYLSNKQKQQASLIWDSLVGTSEQNQRREDIITDAIDAYINMLSRGMTSNEVLSVLENEPLYKWSRVAERYDFLYDKKYEISKAKFVEYLSRINWQSANINYFYSGDIDDFFVKEGLRFTSDDLERFLNDLVPRLTDLPLDKAVNLLKIELVYDYYSVLDAWDNSNLTEYLERIEFIKDMVESVDENNNEPNNRTSYLLGPVGKRYTTPFAWVSSGFNSQQVHLFSPISN